MDTGIRLDHVGLNFKLKPFADLFCLSALHVRIQCILYCKLGRRGGHISGICLCLFYFIIQYMNKLKFNYFLTKKSSFIDCKNILQSTKSSHFPLKGKVGQLSKRKRVLSLSIYIISLCHWVLRKSYVYYY